MPLIAVSRTFWLDHVDREPLDPGQVLCTPAGQRGACVLLSVDDPGLAPLLSDARYYADLQSMDECPRPLRRAAQAVVAAIESAQVRAAVLAQHVPTYRRRRLGASMAGGQCVGYAIRCACGWERTVNAARRAAEGHWNDHVREALRTLKATKEH